MAGQATTVVRAGVARRAWVGGVLAVSVMHTLVVLGATPAAGAGDGEPYDSRMCRTWVSEPAGDSWAVERLKPEQVWSRTRGAGVKIAVLDTGVDTYDVPQLAGAKVTTVNFTGFEKRESNEGMDDCAHGTGVVALIVGQQGADQENNLTGIAPEAEVIAMRTLQVSGAEGDEKAEPEPLQPTIDAIYEAIRRDVDIINISQQGTDSPEYRAAIAEAISRDIVVIAAAGNRGDDAALPYPAAYPGVIAVGMSDAADRAHPLSQWHPDLSITVAAPGDQVIVVRPSGPDTGAAYAVDSGTSFAAPQVTATVALMLSENPELTVAQVRNRLELTADPPPMAVPDKQLGYGIVNPLRAVTGVVPTQAHTPAPEPSGTPAPDPDSIVGADHTLRNVALTVGGGGVVGLGLAVAFAVSAPAGRRRRWRAADPHENDLPGVRPPGAGR